MKFVSIGRCCLELQNIATTSNIEGRFELSGRTNQFVAVFIVVIAAAAAAIIVLVIVIVAAAAAAAARN